jgi:uncharacterized protein YkwD
MAAVMTAQGGKVAGAALAGAALLALTLVVASPSSAPASRSAGCNGADAPAEQVSKKQFRKALLCLINQERAQRDIPKLVAREPLQETAQAHTSLLVQIDCLLQDWHQCPGEPDLETRMRRAGYFAGAERWQYAENTGCAKSAEAMVANWLHSSFHRNNMLRRRFDDVGIGSADDPPGTQCQQSYAAITAVFAWKN